MPYHWDARAGLRCACRGCLGGGVRRGALRAPPAEPLSLRPRPRRGMTAIPVHAGAIISGRMPRPPKRVPLPYGTLSSPLFLEGASACWAAPRTDSRIARGCHTGPCQVPRGPDGPFRVTPPRREKEMTRLRCRPHRPAVAETPQKKTHTQGPYPPRVAGGAVASQPVYVAVAAILDPSATRYHRVPRQGSPRRRCTCAHNSPGASDRQVPTSADSIRSVDHRAVHAPSQARSLFEARWCRDWPPAGIDLRGVNVIGPQTRIATGQWKPAGAPSKG